MSDCDMWDCIHIQISTRSENELKHYKFWRVGPNFFSLCWLYYGPHTSHFTPPHLLTRSSYIAHLTPARHTFAIL